MKIIEVVAEDENLKPIARIAKELGVHDYWWGEAADGRRWVRLLVEPAGSQEVLDSLQGLLGSNGHIIVETAEAVLPQDDQKAAEDSEKAKKSSIEATREELYENVAKGARLDSNFLLLVGLSTIVAANGLIADNVVVLIGAMVIAPLLGPNIALALSTELGDTNLIGRSLRSNLAGLGLAVVISIIIAKLWPVSIESRELFARTDVGLDGVALALASGAAAALSFTTGLSTVLVGVMVAVALLPPAATMGLMIGSGNMNAALGAGLLLAVNIVCVNLAAKIIFLLKGVKPRTWLQMEKARQSTRIYMIFWLLSLALLVGIILLRQKFLAGPG